MTITLDGTNGLTTPGVTNTGNDTVSLGVYAKAAFTGTFTDGIVVDYTTGLGRISVGTSDGLAFYNGGVGNTALASIDSSGNLSVNGGTVPVNRIVQGTAQTTNGSATYGYTGIPSWVKKITVQLNSINYNSPDFLIQIGSGSYVSSGYQSTVNQTVAGSTTTHQSYSTSGFIIDHNYSYSTNGQCGNAILTNMGSNVWVCSGVTAILYSDNSSYYNNTFAGGVTLSGVLDRVQIICTGGTFNRGSVNIMYEG